MFASIWCYACARARLRRTSFALAAALGDDLLGGARYLWHGRRNYVALDPASAPAHIFRVRRRIRTERDFDYFL